MSNIMIFKIDCEWDMGFHEAYATRELAQKDIDAEDWEICETTLKEAQEDGMVCIVEVDVYTGEESDKSV